MAFDIELGFDTELCHCGDPILAITQPEDVDDYNYSLVEQYCAHCAATRCDAYPGACGRSSVKLIKASR